jgi:hypothetical protein
MSEDRTLLIAGLVEGPDAAAALIEVGPDGTRVLAVVHQQSVDRVLHSAAFPSAALDACLDAAGRKPRDLDRIVVTNLTALPRRWADLEASRPTAGRALARLLRRTGAYRLVHDRAADRIQEWAQGAGFRATVTTLEVDLAYAHLAYRTQNEDPVQIVVAGYTRDGGSVSLFEARNGQIDPMEEPPGLSASNLADLKKRMSERWLPVVYAGPILDALAPNDDTPHAPIVGSAAAALGAALWDAGSPPQPLSTLLLGPTFTSDAAYKALSNATEPRNRASEEEILAAAIEQLNEGRTIAWARGPAGAEADLLPSRALLTKDGAGRRLVVASQNPRAGDVVVTEPLLAALIERAGPIHASPLARAGEPAALTPTDVVRTFRAERQPSRGERAVALLVLHDYLCVNEPLRPGTSP